MDFQNKRETLNEEQGGYESYRSDGATRTKANDTKRHEAELAIERDIVMTEYKTDRDVILKAIKESIKRRDYDDAQAFIHKYRFAAKTDDDFSILAKLLAQKLETQQKIEKIQTVIDATDDNDTTALIALNERILRIDPDHQEAKAALRALRGDNEIDSNKKSRRKKRNRYDDDDDLPAPNCISPHAATIMLTLATVFFEFWGLGMLVASVSVGTFPTITALGTMGIYGYLFIPYSKNTHSLTLGKFFTRILIAIFVFIVFCLVLGTAI